MTFTDIANNPSQIITSFQQFDVDDQLALLWDFYTEMRESITPDPSAGSFAIAQSLVHQMQQMSQEEQLQIQRDILAGRTEQAIARAYGEFHSSNRLGFWYLLAQGMENGSIVPMPENYDFNSEAQDFRNSFRQLEFNDQVTVMRNLITCIGPKALEGDVA